MTRYYSVGMHHLESGPLHPLQAAVAWGTMRICMVTSSLDLMTGRLSNPPIGAWGRAVYVIMPRPRGRDQLMSEMG